MKTTVDLRELADALANEFPAIQALWLFGSRRHRTRSIRSDIDLLVCVSDYIRPNDFRNAIRRHCPALDLFIVDDGKATSCMNESFVQAEHFDALRTKLDAVCVWSRVLAEIDSEAPFIQEIRTDIVYVPTSMDGGEPWVGRWGPSVDDYFKQVDSDGLPTKPFVGDTSEEIAEFIHELCGRLVATIDQLANRSTRANWKPVIKSEYDFQDAFFLAMKPWFPDLGREEVTIRFDEQDKRSDFSLLKSRIVIEMKYINDANSKSSVVKSLEGLAGFYQRNANVDILLFLIAVAPGVDVDAARWAREFSYTSVRRRVITRVYALR